MSSDRTFVAVVAVCAALLLGYLLFLLTALALHDSLTSVANDAANYLVMARHYSPWREESGANLAAWILQDFPPAFPLLLAISGTAHSLYHAHVMVLVLGLIGLLPVYLWARRLLEDRALALAVTALFALTPGFVLGLQGILSEAFYLLLSATFLYLYERSRQGRGTRATLGLAVLLALVILTRSQGYVLLIAVACQALVAIPTHGWRASTGRFFLCAAAAGLTLLVMSLIGPERESHYFGVLMQFLAGEDPTQLGGGRDVLLTQVLSLVDGWRSFLLLYWVGDFKPPSLIALLLLSAACVGTALRLRDNRLDGWYVAGGLALLLIWPHPGQMVRLLFPLVPLMLVQGLYALVVGMRRAERLNMITRAGLLACLVGVAPVLTAHAFIHGRLAIAQEQQLVPVYEMFRRLDVDRARWELQVQNQMLRDFRNLRETAAPGFPLYYVSPEYPALFSDRIGIIIPHPADAALDRIREFRGGEVLLTRILPRMNREGMSGFDGSAAFQDAARLQGCTVAEGQQEPVSCLFTLPRPRLGSGAEE